MPSGSIRKRIGKKGTSYQVRISDGVDPVTGQRRWITETFDRRRDAEDWRTKTLNALHQAVYVQPSAEPLSQWLDHWLATSTVAPSTQGRYAGIIRYHLKPTLGTVTLKDLHPRRIQALYNAKREEIPASAALVHVVLHAALDQAVREGALPRNPCDGLIAPPKRQARPSERIKVWTPAQLAEFLSATTSAKHHAAWWLAAHTGLRGGELVALRWVDLDLERLTLRVAQSQTKDAEQRRYIDDTKTTASRRTIGIDQRTASVLREQRARQATRRLSLGPEWQDHGLVFDRGDGVPFEATAVAQNFAYHVGRLGLPEISLHGLRHTHASILLAEGRPTLYVSRRLGHASIRVTLDLYGHLIPGTEWDDAEAFADAMERAGIGEQGSSATGA